MNSNSKSSQLECEYSSGYLLHIKTTGKNYFQGLILVLSAVVTLGVYLFAYNQFQCFDLQDVFSEEIIFLFCVIPALFFAGLYRFRPYSYFFDLNERSLKLEKKTLFVITSRREIKIDNISHIYIDKVPINKVFSGMLNPAIMIETADTTFPLFKFERLEEAEYVLGEILCFLGESRLEKVSNNS